LTLNDPISFPASEKYIDVNDQKNEVPIPAISPKNNMREYRKIVYM